MAPDLEQLAKLLHRKWAEWEQAPGGAINYVQHRGSDALAEELAADPALHLAKVCGIFTNPPEEAMADGVKAVLGLVNPLWGGRSDDPQRSPLEGVRTAPVCDAEASRGGRGRWGRGRVYFGMVIWRRLATTSPQGLLCVSAGNIQERGASTD